MSVITVLDFVAVPSTDWRLSGVGHIAFFLDPDGNDLMLHHRYAPREQELEGT